MNRIDVEKLLSQTVGMPQVLRVAEWATGSSERLCGLLQLAGSSCRRTAVNALWVMTHLTGADAMWLSSRRDVLTDMLLAETDTAKKRLLLRLLRDMAYDADGIRTDLLDFCLSKINSECEPYAIRCFSLYAAFGMCRHYPELLDELERHLDMMSCQPLSPGLRSALRQTRARMAALRRRKK